MILLYESVRASSYAAPVLDNQLPNDKKKEQEIPRHMVGARVERAPSESNCSRN
jgi:hypothetical protein